MSEQYKTQRDRLLVLLSSRGAGWVPLPEILALGIAQYNARIYELRAMGHDVEMKDEWRGRARHTWYRLVPRNAQAQMFEGDRA